MATLTELMIKYRQLQLVASKAQEEADAVRQEIEAEVVKLKATQKYEGVVASYRKGISKCNWLNVATELKPAPEIVEKHTKHSAATSWKDVCDEFKDNPRLEELVKANTVEGEPSVTVTLTE